MFDEQRFFEAHEFFEYAWKADDVDDRDRRFWKGVTQVAVGCCHAQRGNGRGALALLERAAGHLQRFPSPYWGVDTTALISVARSVADQVRLPFRRIGLALGCGSTRLSSLLGSCCRSRR